MKIDDRFFSFPPHVVVAWDQVSSLQGKHQPEGLIQITLHLLSGHLISLPSLPTQEALRVFQGFQGYQETKQLLKIRIKSLADLPSESGLWMANTNPLLQGAPLSPGGFEQFTRSLKHNPQMKDLPSLPKDTLERIAHAARLMFSSEEGASLPQPHPGCHCIYCQISRAIQGGMEQADLEVEEDDLRLTTWKIEPFADDRYLVASTSDPTQRHEVNLKPEISCTCGQSGCDHIAAVLRS